MQECLELEFRLFPNFNFKHSWFRAYWYKVIYKMMMYVCRWLQTCCCFPRGIAWCATCPTATGWRSLHTLLSAIWNTPNSARRILSSTKVIRFYFHYNHTPSDLITSWMSKLQLWFSKIFIRSFLNLEKFFKQDYTNVLISEFFLLFFF